MQPVCSTSNGLTIAALVVATVVTLRAQPIIPTDGMVITQNTTFVAGVYNLPSGVSIGASGVTLDMNGAVLVGGSFNNYGVTCIGHDDVTIRNGTVLGYYYGMRIESGARIRVESNILSSNWVDPASLTPAAPFLNINVGPNLGDRTNLGGGLFLRAVSSAVVTGNILRNQENGIDLYSVTGSTISGNDASDNTGWGIHLNASTGNVIIDNHADRCTRPGLGDSAGVLVVFGSSGNQFVNNTFTFGGDGFFIGNEGGCPSNNNLVQGNDGSYAGANAFEATFSSGNQFINNIASFSNYGFWLGYSHSGNLIRGNVIRANNTNGIEIEHGRDNSIEANQIIGNGGRAIVLRTDGLVHFPPAQFPCLALGNQAISGFYTIRDNVIHSNLGTAIELTNTTDSVIVNNLVHSAGAATCISNGANNVWSITPTPGVNVVGGPTLGGNYWSNYAGVDNDADGLGDTLLPYHNGGQLAAPGDAHPLIGNPDIGGLSNPRTLCDHTWSDQGRNTRSTGQVFDTANGAHFASDGTDLYLLEGTNSNRLSRFDPATRRYVARAACPDTVFDGGCLQFGGGLYYATVGLTFNTADGSGKGSFFYAYNAAGNAWATLPRTRIGGFYYANEALAYDPLNQRVYATIVNKQSGGDANATRKLAIFDVAANTWTGLTAACTDAFSAGSEAEYLGGKIYVWRGGLAGGSVNGADSYLNVYDIAANAWSRTPSLLDSGVVPGFRSGGFDVWGIGLAADAARGRVFVSGAETNKQVYVFDIATQNWRATRSAAYDGGWGSTLEYVANADRLYLIDGRNAASTAQGTAALVAFAGDLNSDCTVNEGDLGLLLSAWLHDDRGDLTCDGRTDESDLGVLLSNWGHVCP
ncbi:MAG: right-handed parallel beta-helix repeat-containing protein [Phycisphaerae bacterium]